MADGDEPGEKAAAEDPPQKYDQGFFLGLAAKGKDVWNAWRRNQANKDVDVTFAGVDFSQAPKDQINFEEFTFGDDANFSGCKWRGRESPLWRKEAFTPGHACFVGAAFGDRASFDQAAFGDWASFAAAAFGGWARFNDAAFGYDASFARAAFGDMANFAGAAFGYEASFAGAAFGYMANFAGAAFGGAASFAGAAFRNWASFAGAAFSYGAIFAGAAFGHYARFDGAAFGKGAIFAGAAFGGSASFDGAAFGDGASFDGADFGDASFDGAAFGDNASFAVAAFGNYVSFDGAAFGNYARFDGAAFGNRAIFDNTFFKGRVEFAGKSEEQWARDVASAPGLDEESRTALEKRHKDSWKSTGSRLDRFSTISFSRARFDGVAVFSGRSFEKAANFTNACLYSPPDFDAATNLARIDFSGAYIGFARPGRLHWTMDTKVPLRLRAIRKIAEETKNHDLERDLYIEERKAERGVYWHQLVVELKKAPEELKKKLEDINKQKKHVWLEWRLQRRARNAHRLGIAVKIARLAVHGFWIIVMGLYWALADYGRSFARPAAWLVSSGFFFYWCYGKILAPLMPKGGTLADKYQHAVGMVALGNAVPFVGPLTIDAEIKKFLFCAGDANCLPIPPEGFQLLVVGQNVVSIILVFFVGLALRNYFRIK